MIRLITDSTADLDPRRARELGVEVIPLSVHFGDTVYLDGVDITPEQFYEKLAGADRLPTTSQVNPDVFTVAFEKHLAAGDEVLGIFLSSELSGTFQSAAIARDMTDPKRVRVVDSRSATFGLGLLVEQVKVLMDQGLGLDELEKQANALAGRVRLLAAVDTLKYLKMGGRISAATAVVGGLLGVTPIIAVQGGIVEAAGKTRGRKAAFAWIREELERRPADLSLPVGFGYSAAPEILEENMAYFKDWSDQAPFVITSDIGAVIGTHAGPKATGLAYFEAK